MDVDWLPLQFIDRSDVHDFEQFSQEIRWAADIGDRFTYTLGGYIDQNELDMQGQVVIDTNFDGLFPEFLALANGLPPEAAALMPQNLITALTADSPLNGIPGYGVTRPTRYRVTTPLIRKPIPGHCLRRAPMTLPMHCV